MKHKLWIMQARLAGRELWHPMTRPFHVRRTRSNRLVQMPRVIRIER